MEVIQAHLLNILRLFCCHSSRTLHMVCDIGAQCHDYIVTLYSQVVGHFWLQKPFNHHTTPLINTEVPESQVEFQQALLHSDPLCLKMLTAHPPASLNCKWNGAETSHLIVRNAAFVDRFCHEFICYFNRCTHRRQCMYIIPDEEGSLQQVQASATSKGISINCLVPLQKHGVRE